MSGILGQLLFFPMWLVVIFAGSFSTSLSATISTLLISRLSRVLSTVSVFPTVSVLPAVAVLSGVSILSAVSRLSNVAILPAVTVVSTIAMISTVTMLSIPIELAVIVSVSLSVVRWRWLFSVGRCTSMVISFGLSVG